jgi:hypothetical protein
MKIHKPLPIPEDSAWDRKTWKTYVPIWLKEIINGISNIIKWAPIIYKDRNWDYRYIFEMLKFKLIQQRKELVNANIHTRIEDANRYITICLNLIELIQEEYHACEYLDYVESNFRFEPTGEQYEGQNTYELKDEIISERYDEYLNKYKSSVRHILKNGYRGLEIEEDDKGRLCLYVGQYNQEKCQKLLFKVLNEKINHWWD